MEIQAVTVEISKLQLGENDRLVVTVKPNLSEEDRAELIKILRDQANIKQQILFLNNDIELSTINISQP